MTAHVTETARTAGAADGLRRSEPVPAPTVLVSIQGVLAADAPPDAGDTGDTGDTTDTGDTDTGAELSARAERAVRAALREVGGGPESGDGAVRDVRVRLCAHRDPAVHFPVIAEANLDLAGTAVRAQAHAATAREAVDALYARLCHQLERAARPPGADHLGHWRHPRPPQHWVATYPRPATACRIVRRKPCRSERLGLDEAIHQMECRDFQFHLFTEAGSGQDSVVYRAGPTGYRLAQVRPDPSGIAAHTVAVSCYDRPAPRLDIAEAVAVFGMTEVQFLFFVASDRADGGRASVLYRRFDGHYGLIHREESGPR